VKKLDATNTTQLMLIGESSAFCQSLANPNVDVINASKLDK